MHNIRRSADWLTAKIDEQLVMMSAVKGSYVGLSKVGARIWELAENPRTVEELCAQLQSEYDVSADVCRAEVESFLGELQQHGAITFDPA